MASAAYSYATSALGGGKHAGLPSPSSAGHKRSLLGTSNSMSSSNGASSSSSSSWTAAADVYLCPSCAAPAAGATACARHGNVDGNMVYKCKWCCSVATHFCRGINHYCDRCHGIADQNARTKGTPLDWGPILKSDRSRQCDGGGKCALGVKHPPHGTAFCLGCGPCKAEAEAARVM